MQPRFWINGEEFAALTLQDATSLAINRARELMRAGETQAANALYNEAMRLRKEHEHAMRVFGDPLHKAGRPQVSSRPARNRLVPMRPPRYW